MFCGTVVLAILICIVSKHNITTVRRRLPPYRVLLKVFRVTLAYYTKANVAPCNSPPCLNPTRPLMNLSSDTWDPINFPSPHGLRYCLLVMDHHTKYMWVRLLKSKDDTCTELDSILLDIRHLHARHHIPMVPSRLS
jgi:hypothetical protein